MTQKEAAIHRLDQEPPGTYLAVHEFNIPGVSENSLASRLPELAKSGAVVSRIREGKPYKEWALAEVAPALPGLAALVVDLRGSNA